MKIKTTFPIMAAAVIFLLCGCGNSTNEIDDLEAKSVPVKSVDSSENKVSRKMLKELIGSFPTPVEMALTIKQSHQPFDKEFLLNAADAPNFSSNYEKAIAMGGYSADMGIIHIYGKSLMAVEYLGAVRTLAKQLDLEQFFDFRALLDMARNSSNIDSLTVVTTKSFNDMDGHLREKGRDELSLLIIFGTWLEGLNVFSNYYLAHPSEELRNRIAEQKVSLEKMNLIMTAAYETDPYFEQLTLGMEPLVELYKGVILDYVYKEPEMVEVNGQLVVVDKSEMKIVVTDETIKQIAKEIRSLRKSLLK
jgi:hypothetical protein